MQLEVLGKKPEAVREDAKSRFKKKKFTRWVWTGRR